LDAAALGSFADQYDGMIVRFDMRTIGVGVAEALPPSSNLVVFPSPAADHIRLSGPEWMNAACSVRITDVSGRIVLEQLIGSDSAIPVRGLAAGSYLIQVTQAATSYAVSNRFIKQ
jgi:hypothetical protein